VLLNKIWALQSLIGNHFYPQQKLVSKVRDGAKIAKKYDTAQTPHARVIAHSEVKALPKRRLAKEHERSQRRREPAKHPPRAALANPTAHYAEVTSALSRVFHVDLQVLVVSDRIM